MKNFCAFVVSLLVICALVGCACLTVRGQENTGTGGKEQFYREQEQKLLKETREKLAQMGFADSGVMLNRVVEREVERTYTFTIHHSQIDAMEPAQRQELAEKLAILTEQFPCAVPEDTCTFQFCFLVL